jgi:hypothetical protein
MIFGKKSDLKSHLSMKRPSWTHKVVAHSALEPNQEMDRQEASPPQREPPPNADRPEPMRSRY